jgi:Ring finger domain
LLFSFPLLQVILTYRRFINKKVFCPPFHLIIWWTPLYSLVLWKGIPNDLVNMSPNKSLALYAISCLAFSTIFMFLQSKFGLFFYLPSDWIPGNANMKRKVSKVPKEKLEEICSICYSALKYDIGAPDDHVELLEAGVEDSQLLPHAEEIFVTPCDHYFHVNCLLTWLTTKKQTCPLCNRPVNYIE